MGALESHISYLAPGAVGPTLQAQARVQHAMLPFGAMGHQLTEGTLRRCRSLAPRAPNCHRAVLPAASPAGPAASQLTCNRTCRCSSTGSARRSRHCAVPWSLHSSSSSSRQPAAANASAQQHQRTQRRHQQRHRHRCHAGVDGWGDEPDPPLRGQPPPDPWAAMPKPRNSSSSASSSGRETEWQQEPGPAAAGPRIGWRPTPSDAGPNGQSPNSGRWGGWGSMGWGGGNGSGSRSSSSSRPSQAGPGMSNQPQGSQAPGNGTAPGSYASTTGTGSGTGMDDGSGMESVSFQNSDWGWYGPEDWDPADGLDPAQLMDLENVYEEEVMRRREEGNAPRDKWITPLLDLQSIIGAFDPDQSRTEDGMKDEALTNKEESQEAIAFAARLVFIPLLTGALIGRTLTNPVLNFTLANNPSAFAMTSRQKVEGAQRVHMEEARVRMDIAIGRAPPIDETEMLRHLREYALEVVEEERQRNESNLMTLVSDSISSMLLFFILARDVDGRTALFNTLGRLFQGLSDIAKAVLIILVADTMLGYHSEEGWTGFIDVVLGHYGIEGNEEGIVVFVGIIPVAIDVLFKYWVFTGLNKISPGAVVTIKQIDRH